MTPELSSNGEPACPWTARLQGYRDGLLPEKDSRKVASHLAVCPNCRSLVEALPHTASFHAARPGTNDCPPPKTDPNGPVSPMPATRRGLPATLGQYDLEGIIGQGGMGVVYKGWHARLKRPVAIKFLHPHRCSDSGVVRFLREMEAIGGLDHPNIVRALDADEKDGYHFLVMEFLDGLTVGELAARVGPISVGTACEVIRQAALGMQYAHLRSMVHRDIKPSNLLLTPDGAVKILDLGLALLHNPAPLDERLTGGNEVMGTADYMSPEQGANSRDVDIRADVYSLGCTLYMLLSGSPPFAGIGRNSLFEKIEAHKREPVPPLRRCRPEVPADVGCVVEKMLAKAPADRFATPKEVADALVPFARRDDLIALVQQAMSGSSRVPGDRSSATTPVAPPRKRLWHLAVACSALVLLVALGTWFLVARNPPLATDPPSATLTPDVFHDMLSREPKVLVFPERDSRWGFDAGKRELWVDANATALFELGETDADDYEIEVFVHQSQWGEGFGMFFGYRENGKSTRYQVVEMGTNMLIPPQRTYCLERAIYRKGPGEQEAISRFGSVPITTPGTVPIPLRLTVAKGELQRVTWGGEELPGLIGVLPGPRVDQPDSRGAFGLYAHSCAVTFRGTRFLYRKGTSHVQP